MISLEDVLKRYPGQSTPALNGVSFAVEQGDICGIVGLSGAARAR